MEDEDILNLLKERLEIDNPQPRYVYHFDDEINSETVQGLIDILSGYSNIDLFFTTPGGELHAMRVLIHFINNHPDINIYMTGYVASAGTFLFLECNKPITLCEDLDWILFHLGDRMVEGQFRKTTLNYEVLKEQLKETNDKLASSFLKLGLTKKEIKAFLEGDDVVLYRKDFNRLQSK